MRASGDQFEHIGLCPLVADLGGVTWENPLVQVGQLNIGEPLVANLGIMFVRALLEGNCSGTAPWRLIGAKCPLSTPWWLN